MAIYGNNVSKHIVGRVEVLLNGELLLIKSGAVARGIGEESGKPAVNRKTISDCFGTAGFVEELVPASLEVTLTARDDIDLKALASIKGSGTLIFRRAVNPSPKINPGIPKTFVLERVTCISSLSIITGEGEIPIVFEACEGNGWIVNDGGPSDTKKKEPEVRDPSKWKPEFTYMPPKPRTLLGIRDASRWRGYTKYEE